MFYYIYTNNVSNLHRKMAEELYFTQTHLKVRLLAWPTKAARPEVELRGLGAHFNTFHCILASISTFQHLGIIATHKHIAYFQPLNKTK